jgi:hypothetical protein
VASPEQSEANDPSGPESVSAFVAQVLNQIKPTAWLPAAFLIVGVALLAWLRVNDGDAFEGVEAFLESNWIAILVFALPTFVIAALLTQAFSAVAIASLEGYWHGSLSWLEVLGMAVNLRRKHRIHALHDRALKNAFNSARPALIEMQVDERSLEWIEAGIERRLPKSDLTADEATRLGSLSWWELCDPWHRVRMQRLLYRLEDFPEDSRIMPTKLGNILRAAHDLTDDSESDSARFDSIPRRLLQRHKDCQDRLEMHCTLVFVAALLAVASIPALLDVTLANAVVVPLAFASTAWANYQASLVYARDDRRWLRAISIWMRGVGGPIVP